MYKIKCYVIDDEVMAVKRLESLLSKLENVEVVSDSLIPSIAIEEILKLKPDLIFMDIEMVDKSGFEMIEEIRNESFFPAFVFVTAHIQYAINAIKKDVFDYLIKPINLDELKSTIDRYRLESANHKSIDLSKNEACKDLSSREIEVLLLLIKGETSHEIAKKLFISEATVNFHRKNILLKTQSHNFTRLIWEINKIDYKNFNDN